MLGPDEPPVPLWKLPVPATVAERWTPVDDAMVSALVERRMAAIDSAHNSPNAQEPYSFVQRVALLPLRRAA